MAHYKLLCHHLDLYQHTAFQCGIVRRNVGEEEADPVLETAMEYASALGTIIFDESCCLCDLMEAQVGRNQFAMDVAVDRLDREVDHASKRLSALEGKVMDMEAGYTELLALGQEQVEMSTQSCRALASLAAMVAAQQQKMLQAEERMDMMREMILGLEHSQDNPIMVEDNSEGETAVSDGVELCQGHSTLTLPVHYSAPSQG